MRRGGLLAVVAVAVLGFGACGSSPTTHTTGSGSPKPTTPTPPTTPTTDSAVSTPGSVPADDGTPSAGHDDGGAADRGGAASFHAEGTLLHEGEVAMTQCTTTNLRSGVTPNPTGRPPATTPPPTSPPISAVPNPPLRHPTTTAPPGGRTTTTGGGEQGPTPIGGGNGFTNGDPNVRLRGEHYIGLGEVLNLHAEVTSSNEVVTLNWETLPLAGSTSGHRGDETLLVHGCDAVFTGPSTIGSGCETEYDVFAWESPWSHAAPRTDDGGDAAIPTYDGRHCGLPGPAGCSGDLVVSTDTSTGAVESVTVLGVGTWSGPPTYRAVIGPIPKGTYTVTVETTERTSDVTATVGCTTNNAVSLR